MGTVADAARNAGSRGSGRLLTLGLGIAAFVVALGVALTAGRSLGGGGSTGPFLIPLAVSGALALALGVAGVAATEIAQPDGLARARRALAVVAPFATLIAFFAYSSDPVASVRAPFAAGSPTVAPLPTRPVSPNDPVLLHGPGVAPPTRTPVRAPEGPVAGPASGPVPGPVVPGPPRLEPAAERPPVVVQPRPVPPRVIDRAPVRPAVVTGVSSPEKKSFRPGSSGCQGRRGGLGRSRQAPRPRPCRPLPAGSHGKGRACKAPSRQC